MIIDQLPSIGTVQSTDEIPIERGTTTYKTTVDGLEKVSRAGDTMTGTLTSTATGDAVLAVHGVSGQQAYFTAHRTDTDTKVSFGVGTAGTNHGVYSFKLGKWMVYGNASEVILNGTAENVSGTVAIEHGGTGATSASAARSALGLAFSSDYHSVSNGSSYTYSLNNSERGVVLISGSGSNNSSKEIAIYNTTSGGGMTLKQILSPSGITITTTSTPPTLKVQNSSGAALFALRIIW